MDDGEMSLYHEEMNKLKFAAFYNKVTKGLKETIRAIKSNKTKQVYLAKECDLDNYLKVIEEFCTLYEVKIVKVNDWKEIRDIVINCVPSDILIEKSKRLGKEIKITPKCYCAAILTDEGINK